MRFLIALIVVLASISPALAQEPDTSVLDGSLAAECGAVDYLMERHEHNKIFNDAIAPLWVEDTPESLADLYGHAMIYRAALLSMEVPECAAILHELTINRVLTVMDGLTFFFASEASFLRNTEFAVLAGRFLERYFTGFDEDIIGEMVNLGWLVPDETSPDGYRYAVEALND